ncbi:hypothetical protein [Pseudoalteromonas sp.]|uniref:hypothetical protein n=1 Tax=Pseudoalteromonas sp. TaxID=53249 RepID=UPI00272A86CC|nr:hypothetical protein [Pseudoalteromonas sp.]
MATVTVYRWDDAGAPAVVEGRPSEHFNVLKKCLVEGYGNKLPAGWSVVHESLPEEPPFIALKNSATEGSGGALMVKSANNNANTRGTIQGCLDFVSSESQARVGPYFTVPLFGNSAGSPNRWIIIATSTAFFYYAFSESRQSFNFHGTFAHQCYFAGDLISFYDNDPSKFVTLSGGINSTSYGWNTQLNYLLGDNPAATAGYIYALDGSESKENLHITSCLGSPYVHQTSIQDSEPEIRVLSPIFATAKSYQLSSASVQGNSETNPFMRGRIPGIFASQESGYRHKDMAFTKLIDGINHLSIARANSGGINFWLNLEEWL